MNEWPDSLEWPWEGQSGEYPGSWDKDDPHEDDLAYMAADDARQFETEDAEWLKRLPYPEYLRSNHWDHTRRRALLRAGHRCQQCEARGLLDVHHLTYERIGRESEADLIVLCRMCHEAEHGLRASSADHAAD